LIPSDDFWGIDSFPGEFDLYQTFHGDLDMFWFNFWQHFSFCSCLAAALLVRIQGWDTGGALLTPSTVLP
jgi:hypothetical protein